MENQIVKRADERGGGDYGWLKTRYSFSFSNYYNPDNIHFGALRVINDDIIAGGMGFGTHPHDNMEIITIPLEGDLAHKDSMGNASVINHGEVQVMSAGTGVTHSEFNANEDKSSKIFQIWIFPKKKNMEPRYGQIKIDLDKAKNYFLPVVTPNKEDGEAWINQDAWISWANFDKDFSKEYAVKKAGNGVYALVVEGSFEVNGTELKKRDAIGSWNIDKLDVKATGDNGTIMLIDVPMEF